MLLVPEFLFPRTLPRPLRLPLPFPPRYELLPPLPIIVMQKGEIWRIGWVFADYKIIIQVRSKSEFYCKIAKQVRSESEFLWCHDFSLWCLLSMLRSIYFNTLIDTTFICVYRFWLYDWSCLFEPTLRSVLLIWTNVTIGVLYLNRCYDRCSWLQLTLRSVILTATDDFCYRLMALLPPLRSIFSVLGPLLPSNVDSTFKL